MQTTKYLLSTLKEIPHESEIISHQLMLRAGIIRKLSSGLYNWLPTGTRVLKKIKKIIRKEMNKIDALEIIMPIMQPSNLWNASNRIKLYGNELFKITDRSKKLFILSPTHEEAITQLIRNEIYSYKQLPIILYQLQTKFRDEIRPQFGVIRSREFIMKDAYSFHLNNHSLVKSYNLIQQCYIQIFNKIHLKFRIIKANSDIMGGHISHEFQAISTNNYDTTENFEYSNIRKKKQNTPIIITKKSSTTKSNLCNKQEKFVKTILVKSNNKCKYPLVILLIRNDHNLNLSKIEKIDIIAKPLKFINKQKAKQLSNKSINILKFINLKCPIIADKSVCNMQNFIIETNIDNKHYIEVNWKDRLPAPIIKNIAHITDNIYSNSYSYSKKNTHKSINNIEIAHIFQIGKQYSKQIKAQVKNINGLPQFLHMGCYGIGLTRTIAAIVEQNHDYKGIIWPDSIAPFLISILPVNMYKSPKVKKYSENLYNLLQEKKIDVLIDDRVLQRPGPMFSEIELIGIPHNIIISDKYIHDNKIEYRNRKYNQSSIINIKEIDLLISKIIKN
ncbi:prolyl-tRNA synthetase [Buchnera aphidicola (Nipponaphis monzeni)]|uniref:Proline--tRNA ligase n=1 Tax=Buchnera aphidicola (Nipponaphis monzeni) TaxID=2495405 RepID=A0A455TA47_9GAMM|nr:proline--tRNA ligase [Buchnera aphidicola]BBI01203.1 prolyl-tRNA synthetase [Buchnera aphidicola (Nipponaphis monzeni)]